MIVKKKIIISLVVLLTLTGMKNAFAQPVIPDPGQIEENVLREKHLEDSEEYLSEPQEPEAPVVEGTVEEPESEVDELTEPDQPAQKELKVQIQGFDINESKILSEEDINQVTQPFIGQYVGIDELKTVTDQFNQLYVKKGFITARAFLPPQTVKNGIVQIKLVEGHVGDISIDGNKWTKRGYITARISQEPGGLFDLKDLEKDILKFNRKHIVKLRANLKPGAEVGETDIQLIAHDPFPYHLTATFDNTGRKTVGVLRGGIGFASDSLFGYRDQFSMGYSRAKTTDVAYSSYNFPIGKYGTRVGGTFAFSNIRISSGPFKNFNIEGNSYNYGGYVSHPFISTRRFDFSGDLGFNFRQVTTFFDEMPLFTTQIRSLTAGLNFEYRDKTGRWMSRHAFTNGLDILGGNARFFKYNGSLTRIQSLGNGVVGIFRAATQLTDDRLPPVEQFQLGGSSTVRGYSEGLLIGDNGYFFSGELRIPLPLPKQIGKLQIRDRIRGVVFVDHGGTFIDDGNISSPHHTDYLTSVGLGLRGVITKYINGRIDWGFALGRREDPQPTARMHFGLEANPF
jgi:hemolysin activation/secretion protein